MGARQLKLGGSSAWICFLLSWSSSDCNVVRQGYSHPDVVQSACPLTCGICGGIRSSSPISPDMAVQMCLVQLSAGWVESSIGCLIDRPWGCVLGSLHCSNGGDQAQWQVTKAPDNCEVMPRLFPAIEARAIPGLRIVTHDGWQENAVHQKR